MAALGEQQHPEKEQEEAEGEGEASDNYNAYYQVCNVRSSCAAVQAQHMTEEEEEEGGFEAINVSTWLSAWGTQPLEV